MSTIRHLAASYSNKIIATGEFEKRVRIFDASENAHVCDFVTDLDFGGRRLAVSDDGSLCAAGSYERSSISVYDTTDGRLMWRRKDLKKVQELVFPPAKKNLLYAFLDNGDGHILDSETGKTLRTLKDTTRKIDSPHSDYECIVHGRSMRLLRGSSGEEIGRRDGTVPIEIAFTDRSLITTELQSKPGRDIYKYNPSDHMRYVASYDLRDLSELWRIERFDSSIQSKVGAGRNDGTFNEIGYSSSHSCVLCVFWKWTPKESMSKNLIYIDADSASVVKFIRLEDLPTVSTFASRDNLFVTSCGQIIDTSNGETKGMLPISADKSKTSM